MNKPLCCILSVSILCHFCREQWCQTCWHNLFPEGTSGKDLWLGSSCPYYSNNVSNFQISQGNHYTMSPDDKAPRPKEITKHDYDVEMDWKNWFENDL